MEDSGHCIDSEFDDRSEAGRPKKLNFLDNLRIQVKNPINSVDFGLLIVASQRKKVADIVDADFLAPSPKPIDRVVFIVVVALQNAAYLLDYLLVHV